MHKEEEHAALDAKYRQAAEQGDAEAQFQLARMYNSCSCHGMERNERKTEALQWFRKAAELGHVEAQYWTGLYYRHGLQVVTKDQTEGDAWFLKAAEKGHTGAMMKLGRYHEAAELGDAYAQYHLGNQCIEKDPTEAMTWYLTATNNPDGQDVFFSTSGKAAYQIAKMHEDGRGVPQDEKTALDWLFKAAEMGDSEAPWDIARRYAKGIGVPKDTAVAAEWYVEAEFRQDDGDLSMRGLDKRCEDRGIPLEEMLTAYFKAAERSDYLAWELAQLYKYGWGVVSPDETESQNWLQKSGW